MNGRSPPPLTVVVVDDEADVAAYLAAVLEKRGHLARTAGSAAEGFDLVTALRPDVICIDIVMPEETGIALVKKIRAHDEVRTTPVVFITALKPEMAAPGSGLGIDKVPEVEEYIEKPPNAEAFVAAVERAAQSRRTPP
jgi:CheY-like chemotaxis protein